MGISAAPLVYLLVCVSALMLVAFGLYRWKASTHEAALIFQAVLTGAAIVVAGYWYVVERRGSPHADVSQTVTQAPLGDGLVAVEVIVSVRNLGSTLLKISTADIRLQQVYPNVVDLDAIRETKIDQWPNMFADGRPMFNGTELQWPILKWYHDKIDNEVEPGETDTIIADFVIPCAVKRYRIATELAKPEGPGLTWKARTFGSTVSECGKVAR